MSTALLLSGGIDSVALAYWNRPEIAITVDYGQKAAQAEVAAAGTICRELLIRHEVIRVDCAAVGHGCMTDVAAPAGPFHPPTPEWWPFRNQLIITIAGANAVLLGVKRLLIGSVCTDRRHRDGTSEFVVQMSVLLRLQEGGLALVAPAIRMTSARLVIRSGIPPGLLAWAHSCHTGDYACGTCPGCAKSRQVWDELASRRSDWLADN
jgi:7-cyano-7-deazaguanine synthase